jgi:hypothetical protein
MHVKNGPALLVNVMECFYLRYSKDIMPLHGKRIAASQIMSYKLLTESSKSLPDSIWMPTSISGSCLDSLRRKLYYEGSDLMVLEKY